MLNVHVLFLCLYKISILIILKISISISRYFQNIVSILYQNWNPDIESSPIYGPNGDNLCKLRSHTSIRLESLRTWYFTTNVYPVVCKRSRKKANANIQCSYDKNLGTSLFHGKFCQIPKASSQNSHGSPRQNCLNSAAFCLWVNFA